MSRLTLKPSAIASWWLLTPGCQRIRSGSLLASGVCGVDMDRELNLELARRLRLLAKIVAEDYEVALILSSHGQKVRGSLFLRDDTHCVYCLECKVNNRIA